MTNFGDFSVLTGDFHIIITLMVHKPLILITSLLVIFCLADISFRETDSTQKSAAEGTIFIISEPSDANIFLNGKETPFRTPATLSGVKHGLNTIEISLPDYLFAKRQINIVPDTTLTISFKLLSLSDTTGSSIRAMVGAETV